MPAPDPLLALPAQLREQVREMRDSGRLGPWLLARYPGRHEVQTDRALYRYVCDLKQEYLRKAPAVDKVCYDSRMDVVRDALGLHTRVSRPHGGRLVTSREIRIAALFRELPPELLRMIVVHELAHLRELDHNRAFYQLCEHMLPDYARLEFDLRLFLVWRAGPPADGGAE
ncbi:MAG TPA: M48 family metallopeptidase [Moraxellaceae bacterium]|nr:M48 family metallopeptidase [Moraxellaceae bacterium]